MKWNDPITKPNECVNESREFAHFIFGKMLMPQGFCILRFNFQYIHIVLGAYAYVFACEFWLD